MENTNTAILTAKCRDMKLESILEEKKKKKKESKKKKRKVINAFATKIKFSS